MGDLIHWMLALTGIVMMVFVIVMVWSLMLGFVYLTCLEVWGWWRRQGDE